MRDGSGRLRALALLSLSLGALAGCSSAPRETRAGFEAVASAEPAPGDDRAPMAELPPAAGAVVAVLQAQAHGVLTQRIVLRGDPDTLGENAIVVKVDRSRRPQDLDGGDVAMPTRAMIARELDEAFAGVEMQLSQTYARNSFGPFGYALGHPNARTTCVYAWEWGIWRQPRLGEGPTGAPTLPTEPTSVRVRLCRSTVGEAEIVEWLKHLQVFPPGSQTPYVDPNYRGGEGGDALAAAGVGYFDVARAPVRERLEPPPRHRKVAHRRHHEKLADIETRAAAAERPARDDVAVPMPGGAPRVAASAADNPLLAPLAAASRPAAAVDDLPLPGRLAPAPKPAAASSLVPLPN
jgi:hypothetical protein